MGYNGKEEDRFGGCLPGVDGMMHMRESFLDKMRVAATCAVILLHTVTGVMDAVDMGQYPVEKRVFLTALDLICWCVPLFLMISGYLFLNPARKTGMGIMLKKYCRRILAALFLFGVPYAWLEQIGTERDFCWEMLGKGFLMVLRGESWSHLWYLYLILLLYILTPFLKWALVRIPRRAVYVLLAVLFAVSSVLPYLYKLFGLEGMWAFPDWGIYFFYYICGYLFATVKEAEKRKTGGAEKRYLPAAALLLGTGMALSRIFGNYTLQMAYNYPFTVALSLLLFAWGVTAPRKAGGESAFWEKAASLSFTVYLIHPVFINIAYKFFHVTPLSFSIWISLPLFFAGTLLLSGAAAWMLYRIAFLRRHVL